jgi:DNA-binding transcriptional LysR family regulator
VYEEGSFSAAANRVHATQSGLSMQIREMEDRYSVRLFDRVPSGVTPTETGRRFYRSAVETLRAAHVAQQELRQLSGKVMGHLRIGLMPTFTRSVLPATLQRLTAEYPLIRVSIVEAYSAQLSDMTLASQLDLSVVPVTPPQDGLLSMPLGRDREFLVSGPHSALPHGAPVRLRELGPLRLVLPGTMNARRPGIERYLAAQGAQVEDILEIDAMLGTLELVAQSDWMTILPGLICHGDSDGVRRKLHPIVDPSLHVSYMRIEPASRSLSEAASVFERFLTEEMTKLIRWAEEF